MKSILYVGATLMIGASIYGFVDYKKTSRSNEFKKMYESKESTEPVTVDTKTRDLGVEPPVIAIEEKTIGVTETVKDELVAEKNTVVTEKPKKLKKKKTLDYKLFSRAPLEEKYLKKELKIPDLKTLTEEPRKTVRKDSFGENKEQ